MNSEQQKLKKKEYNDRYYAKQGRTLAKQTIFINKVNTICSNHELLYEILKNIGRDKITLLCDELLI
jgi:hypothetical protein